MKKILILTCLLIISLNVSAHPGKTDSAGGHTDHSTGEYHYHHGYQAHQHTDGICPYDHVNAEDDSFRDTNTATSSSSKITKNKANVVSNETNNFKKSFWKNNTTLQASICIIILFSLPSLLKTLFGWLKERAEWKKQRKIYYKMYANIDPITLVKVPKDVYLKNDIPVTDGAGKYGRYTVYITHAGKCFHQDPLCCERTMEKHIFEVSKSHKPCNKCVVVPFPEYKWFIEYRKIEKIKEKYNIP